MEATAGEMRRLEFTEGLALGKKDFLSKNDRGSYIGRLSTKNWKLRNFINDYNKNKLQSDMLQER